MLIYTCYFTQTKIIKDMKKVFTLLVCLFALQSFIYADNDKIIPVEQLPQQAQQFIKKYFPKSEVTYAKTENDLVEKSFEVVFSNGDKVEFSKNGEWKEVECKNSSVPLAIVPLSIKDYVDRNYTNAKILKIEKDSKGYEIKISDNGIELKFDKKFNLVGIDH